MSTNQALSHPLRAVAGQHDADSSLITCRTPATGERKARESMPKAAIVCVIEGSVVVRIDHYRERIVRGGDLFLLPYGKAYSACVQSDSARVMVCRFDLGSRLSDSHSLTELMPYRSAESAFHVLRVQPRMEQFLDLLENYLMDGIRCPAFHEAKKRELFFQLFTYYPHDQVAAMLNPMLSDELVFREAVMRNSLNAKNVVELAQRSNYSTSGFIKRFGKTFREPPGVWLTRQRMGRVLEELDKPDKPIKQVVEDCGLTSHEHLWEFCKRHFGASPTEIRSGKFKIKNNLTR